MKRRTVYRDEAEKIFNGEHLDYELVAPGAWAISGNIVMASNIVKDREGLFWEVSMTFQFYNPFGRPTMLNVYFETLYQVEKQKVTNTVESWERV